AMSALHPIATEKADIRTRSCPLCRGTSRSTHAISVDWSSLPSSVVTWDWLACTQALGSAFGPRLRLGDLRQVYVDLLVRYAVEQMPNQVQPCAALVVGWH